MLRQSDTALHDSPVIEVFVFGVFLFNRRASSVHVVAAPFGGTRFAHCIEAQQVERLSSLEDQAPTVGSHGP